MPIPRIPQGSSNTKLSKNGPPGGVPGRGPNPRPKGGGSAGGNSKAVIECPFGRYYTQQMEEEVSNIPRRANAAALSTLKEPRLFVSWVLHSATVLGNLDKPRNAALELVSFEFYVGRNFCKAVRFSQAAATAKRQQQGSQAINYLRTARALLKKISPSFPRSLRLHMEVTLNLAADMSFSDTKVMFKLDEEAQQIVAKFERENGVGVMVDDGLARAFNNIGGAYERIGKPELALERKQMSLKLFQQLHKGKAHVNIAALMSNIGLVLENLGKRVEAIEIKKKGLEMLRSLTVEKPDERVATAVNNLGVSYQEIGQREKGIELQREALAIRRELYRGQDHEKLASSLNNLGAALETSDKRTEGIELLREGLAMNRRLHPTGHRNLAMNLANLGSALLHVDNSVGEARDLLSEAVEMFRQVQPPNQPPGEELAISLSNLGIVEERGQNWDAGLRHKEEALLIRRHMYGDRDSESLATSLCCVGESLARIPARKQEGIDMLKQSIKMYEDLKSETIEVVLAISALLPQLPDADAEVLATQKLPLLKHCLVHAPSYHHSQLTSTFANALKRFPQTSNQLRLKRDAADFAANAENAKIRRSFENARRESNGAMHATAEAVGTETPEAKRFREQQENQQKVYDFLLEKRIRRELEKSPKLASKPASKMKPVTSKDQTNLDDGDVSGSDKPTVGTIQASENNGNQCAGGDRSTNPASVHDSDSENGSGGTQRPADVPVQEEQDEVAAMANQIEGSNLTSDSVTTHGQTNTASTATFPRSIVDRRNEVSAMLVREAVCALCQLDLKSGALLTPLPSQKSQAVEEMPDDDISDAEMSNVEMSSYGDYDFNSFWLLKKPTEDAAQEKEARENNSIRNTALEMFPSVFDSHEPIK